MAKKPAPMPMKNKPMKKMTPKQMRQMHEDKMDKKGMK